MQRPYILCHMMIPVNVKHWHGAKKDSWFSHIAVEVPGEDCSNEWCEPVSDEEYDQLYGGKTMTVKQTAGRDALGEFAPKFAELNDDVLFGQVCGAGRTSSACGTVLWSPWWR